MRGHGCNRNFYVKNINNKIQQKNETIAISTWNDKYYLKKNKTAVMVLFKTFIDKIRVKK